MTKANDCRPGCKGEHYHVAPDHDDGDVILVSGTKPYLWVGRDGEHPITVSGNEKLRRLAARILAELARDGDRGRRS